MFLGVYKVVRATRPSALRKHILKMLLMHGAKHQIIKHFLLTVMNILGLREQQEQFCRVSRLMLVWGFGDIILIFVLFALWKG